MEVIASRGLDTLLFGPMKPVGLVDPRTGRRPFAVVQLRQDNLAASHFSMVGFQTQLKWGEQKRVFRMIPGLEQRRVRALRDDPPQHLRQLARHPGADLRDAPPARACSSPARCRGSRATSSRRPRACWPGSAPRAARAGRDAARVPGGHGAGRARPLHRPKRPRELPAHEHRLRPAARADRSASGTRAEAAGASPQRAPRAPRALPAAGRGAGGVRAAGAPPRDDRGEVAGLPPPPRPRAQRLAPHRPRLRRRPRAVPGPPRGGARAARRASRTSTTSLIRAFLARLHRRRAEEGLRGAQAGHACAPSSATCAARASSSGTPPGRSSRPGLERRIPAHLEESEVAALLEVPGETDCRPARPGHPGAALRAPASAAPSWWASTSATSTWRRRMVRVLGKGRKERIVPFGQPRPGRPRGLLPGPAQRPAPIRRPCS